MSSKKTTVLIAAFFIVLLPLLSLADQVGLAGSGQTSTISATDDEKDVQEMVKRPSPRYSRDGKIVSE